MPSEERSKQAMQGLARPREIFRSAVAEAVDDVHALLVRLRSEDHGTRERHAAELGEFASGRVDVDRFAALFGARSSVEPEALAVMEKSAAVLEAIAATGEDGFFVRIEPGGDLREVVRTALGMAGRAFGAARAIQLARSGGFHDDEHGSLLESFPPDRWNRAERQIAPPLVIRLSGEDLRAGELATFLDGTQKLVLLVDSPAPPAALVRLITPGLLVAQIDDPAKLPALLAVDAPAVIALVPATAARFIHDPAGGGALDRRLTIEHMPAEEAPGRVGGVSAFQQSEELRQLATLADACVAVRAATLTTTSADGGATIDPADQLAAWLLRQAGVAEH